MSAFAELTIARQLRNARTRSGMRQLDLFEQTGISRSAIVAIERGDRSPRLITIDRICDALDVRLVLVPSAYGVTHHNALRHYRRKFSMSQRDLALASGVCQWSIARIETGSSPWLSTAEKLFSQFGLHLSIAA